jgi:hypothetical protein
MRATTSATLRVFLALLALPLAESRARADDKEACVAAADQAQTLRDEGKFRAARAQMMACARDACPALVRRDCDKYLADLDAAQPTVVLGARDAKGNDVAGTRVLLDGVPLVDHLDGKPIAIDPGEHTFRYETSGAASVEQHAVIRVGEKNRILTAILMASTAVVAKPIPVAPPPKPTEPEEASPSAPLNVPVASVVLASVGVVAGVGFAYFGLSGQSDVSNLRATCAPNCAQSQVDSARTKLIVSDVALGVGVVSLAAAAWIFFHRGPQQTASTQSAFQADVQPRPGGGVASFTARF